MKKDPIFNNLQVRGNKYIVTIFYWIGEQVQKRILNPIEEMAPKPIFPVTEEAQKRVDAINKFADELRNKNNKKMTKKEKMLAMFEFSLGISKEIPQEIKNDVPADDLNKMTSQFSSFSAILAMMPMEMKKKLIVSMGNAIDKTIKEKGENFNEEDVKGNFTSAMMAAIKG